MAVEPIVYHRQQLYEQVWTEPLRALAKRYGVSDVALGEVCRKLRVPRPGQGAWERVRAGRKLQRRPLPPLEPGEPETFEGKRFVPEPVDADLQAALEHEQSSGAPIHVAEELVRPHPLVARAGKALHNSKPLHGLLYGGSEPCLDIVVSKAQLPRALRIMDALVTALEARGFTIEVISNPPPSLYERSMKRVEPHRAFRTEVKLGGIAVPIGLREESEWISKGDGKRYTAGNWMSGYSANAITRVGTGVLELQASYRHTGYGRSNWRDGRRKPLEGLLHSFVVGLIKIVHELRLERAAEKRRQEEEAERKRLKEEELKRQAEEADRVKFLEGQLRDRRGAREIREYVAEIQALLDDAGLGHIEHSELAEHLRWAAAHADELDPVSRARRSIREGLAEMRRRGQDPVAPGVLGSPTPGG